MSETVTVIRPPGKGKFGDPVAGTATETTLEGVLVAPGGSSENNTGANAIDTQLALYAPPGADVLPTDRVRVRGDEYEVVGEPADWGEFGLVINLRRHAG